MTPAFLEPYVTGRLNVNYKGFQKKAFLPSTTVNIARSNKQTKYLRNWKWNALACVLRIPGLSYTNRLFMDCRKVKTNWFCKHKHFMSLNLYYFHSFVQFVFPLHRSLTSTLHFKLQYTSFKFFINRQICKVKWVNFQNAYVFFLNIHIFNTKKGNSNPVLLQRRTNCKKVKYWRT